MKAIGTRTFTNAMLLLVGLFGGIALQARSAPTGSSRVPDLVQAHAFALVGADGKVYADLTSSEPGAPALTLRDRGGAARATLCITTDGRPLMELEDKEGHTRMVAQVGTDGVPALMILDAATHARVDLRIEDGGRPWLSLAGKTGSDQVRLYVNREGQSAFDMEDKTGGTRISMNGSDSGSNLFLGSSDPFTHTELIVAPDRLPFLSLQYPGGKRSISLGDDPQKHTRLSLKSGDAYKELVAP
jgi:hypothetical protein